MSAADDLDRALQRVCAAGIRRVESFAWRDLDDPEAGGSELHADEIFTRWAATGLVDIEHRTSPIDAPSAGTATKKTDCWEFRAVGHREHRHGIGRVVANNDFLAQSPP